MLLRIEGGLAVEIKLLHESIPPIAVGYAEQWLEDIITGDLDHQL